MGRTLQRLLDILLNSPMSIRCVTCHQEVVQLQKLHLPYRSYTVRLTQLPFVFSNITFYHLMILSYHYTHSSFYVHTYVLSRQCPGDHLHKKLQAQWATKIIFGSNCNIDLMCILVLRHTL